VRFLLPVLARTARHSARGARVGLLIETKRNKTKPFSSLPRARGAAALSTVVVTTMVQTKDGKQRDVVLSSVVRVIRITAKDGARAWGCCVSNFVICKVVYHSRARVGLLR
jgi:hypothetical protein